MDKTEELREEIRKRNDLLPKLIELWKNNASVDDTMKVIKDAGFDVTYEDVEKLLALIQKIHAKGIALEKIDMDELCKVSGGWCFAGATSQGKGDSCNDLFKDSRYWEKDVCALSEYCDQFFIRQNCASNYDI